MEKYPENDIFLLPVFGGFLYFLGDPLRGGIFFDTVHVGAARCRSDEIFFGNSFPAAHAEEGKYRAMYEMQSGWYR